jgi:hypothetical protein
MTSFMNVPLLWMYLQVVDVVVVLVVEDPDAVEATGWSSVVEVVLAQVGCVVYKPGKTNQIQITLDIWSGYVFDQSKKVITKKCSLVQKNSGLSKSRGLFVVHGTDFGNPWSIVLLLLYCLLVWYSFMYVWLLRGKPGSLKKSVYIKSPLWKVICFLFGRFVFFLQM